MKIIIEIFLIGITSFILSLVLIPILRRLALRINWVDQPNSRKLHTKPIPIIGGIAITLSTGMSVLVSSTVMTCSNEHLLMFSASLVLFIMGVLDDKMDIKPIFKLIIQLACAYFIADSGIRITSLYGIFGIQEIPISVQYPVTIIVITGLVNAFNLMDGADGVAGGLAIIGFSALAILSFIIGRYELTILYMALIGSIIGFLRFNLSQNKIFLGDGGSLSIGFILAVSGLKLLEPMSETTLIEPSTILLIVIGIFMIPVLDSLRVYTTRIRKGVSPFKPDKTHIHHLLLLLGLSHKVTALTIVLSSLLMLIFIVGLSFYFSLTTAIICVSAVFLICTNILNINKGVSEWKDRIQEMENK